VAPDRKQSIEKGLIIVFGRRMFSATTTSDLAQTRALWDQLRAAATSDRERHELDAIFSRQMP
jgi:hypothetical protein